MTTRISGTNIQNGSITGDDIASNTISYSNLSSSAISQLGNPSPTITNIQITDSSYNVVDDTAVSTSGGYIKITGTNFTAGSQVVIGSVVATSVGFVSSTTLNVQVPAQAAGTYVVYVTVSNGSVAIRVNGLNYSGTPSWVTTSPLAGSQVDAAISIQLSATGDAPITYSLAAGSSLPSGLSLSSGGLLSGSVTGITVETTYNFTVNAIDPQLQDSPRAFSITISANDQYFEYVTSLLSAATPARTFVTDASTNAFAVTVNGDARPSNFGPYTPGYYSNYFDGSGDNLTITSTSALSLNASDFTIECWYYKTGTGDGGIFSQWSSGGQIAMEVLSTGRVYYLIWVGSNVYVTATSTIVVNNAWNHIALVRNGATITIYVNGVADATTYNIGSTAISWYQGSFKPTVIGYWADSAHPLQGYISNFRYIVGTAVYTSNFTPPTTPLTAIANTQLLTCQSNRFIDNSTNNFAITRNGDVRVDSFDPFLPDSNFAGRGSAYFDGTGDFVYVNSSGSAFTYPGDFTIEFWVYPISAIVAAYDPTFFTNNANGDWNVGNAGIRIQYGLVYLGSGSTTLTFTNQLAQFRWQHVALVRSGTTVTMYLNGVNNGTVTYSGTLGYDGCWPALATSDRAGSGGRESPSALFADWRIVKGTAVYTGAFTPPTAPLTAVANTSLLTLQNNQPNNNSMFLDSSTNNFNITRVGNTTQGSFSPYGGGWSAYFDGNGDYLRKSGQGVLPSDNSDITIECWIYPLSSTITGIFDGGPAEGGIIRQYGANVVAKQGQEGTGAPFTITANQWQHFACTFSSGVIKVYINGSLSGSGSYSGGYGAGSNFDIGGINGATAGAVNGYISNFRVTNSLVYTTNFTPPTTPLTPIAGTRFLTCADNRFIDDSSNNFAITRNGDVSIQRFNPFNPAITTPTSYSGYFDGTGDFLKVSDTNLSQQLYNLGTSGDFTVEAWVYPTVSIWSGYNDVFLVGSVGMLVNAGKLIAYGFNNNPISSTTMSLNAWTHIAICRSSGTLRGFQNGVQVFSVADTNQWPQNSPTRIGVWSGESSEFWQGYISNLRVSNNARYTSAFTPSTAPFTTDANTLFLTCQSATFIDNSANNFAITANGDTAPRQFNPFGWTSTTGSSAAYTPALYGGSGYFDGSGDSLSLANNAAFNLSSGDFTVECWVYRTGDTGAYYEWIVGKRSTGGLYPWSWSLQIGSNNKFSFYNNTTEVASTTTALLNTWYHVAAVRQSGTLRLYVNGVQEASSGSYTINEVDTPLTIGNYPVDNPTFTGYMSDLRIVKGTAVYTSNFQPPIAPLTARQNTVLLNNMTGAGIYDSSMITTYETVGNASISTSLKKYGNTSMYFDGTGDYLFTPTSPNLTFGTGDFTVEMWLRTGTTADQLIFDMRPNGGNGAYPTLYYSGGVLAWLVSSANRIVSGAISQNTWYHVAISRSGTSTRMFLDGVQTGSTYTDTTNYLCDRLFIGASASASGAVNFLGYLDDLRITKGVARYTANFTPPASPVIQF